MECFPMEFDGFEADCFKCEAATIEDDLNDSGLCPGCAEQKETEQS